jgi:hypothetical protein
MKKFGFPDSETKKGWENLPEGRHALASDEVVLPR